MFMLRAISHIWLVYMGGTVISCDSGVMKYQKGDGREGEG